MNDEISLDLLKDGGRLVLYGGDPYEDDVEPAELGDHGEPQPLDRKA